MSMTYYVDDRPRYSSASRPAVISPSTVAADSTGRYTPAVQGPDEFSEYELYDIPDWDGYGADPISAETVNAARRLYRLLPRSAGRPDIAPGSDGTIGFEWRSGAVSDRTITFIEVGPGNRIRASRYYAGRSVLRHTPMGTSVISFMSTLFPSNEPA
jgi:hypothetical protein